MGRLSWKRVCSGLVLFLAILIGSALKFFSLSEQPEGRFFATVFPLAAGFVPPTLLAFGDNDALGVEDIGGASVARPLPKPLARPAKEQFVTLPSGAEMPANGLGLCCRSTAYGFEAVRRSTLHYFQRGGRLLDTADLYLNHAPISLAMHEAMRSEQEGGYGLSRKDIFVTTKIFPRHFGRETVKKRVREIVRGSDTKFVTNSRGERVADWDTHFSQAAVAQAKEDFHGNHENARARENSLRLDYADLVLMHAPAYLLASLSSVFVRGGMSEECRELSWKECRTLTWIGLSELVQEGLIRDVGVSNFNVKHMKQLVELGGAGAVASAPVAKVATNQIMWNPWAPGFQREIFDYCVEKGVVVTAYGSLGMAPQFKQADQSAVIRKIASETKKSPQQVMLRWALQLAGGGRVSIIPGTSKPRHMEANLAVYDFELSAAQMETLGGLADSKEAAEFTYQQWPESV